jgi:hypothetical protein
MGTKKMVVEVETGKVLGDKGEPIIRELQTAAS